MLLLCLTVSSPRNSILLHRKGAGRETQAENKSSSEAIEALHRKTDRKTDRRSAPLPKKKKKRESSAASLCAASAAVVCWWFL